jgi:ferredoxin
VHCEYFKGPAAAPPARLEDDLPFVVKLGRSGGEYDVRPGETILDVLRRHGVDTRSSCELGYCGTCLTRYLVGEVDHRDPILNDAARKTHLLICCSRAKSAVLELDL